ncbi:hypothetical protein CQW23_03507 [Capsicum baccatum]|uniref:Uncharacterized protein n=1 Tax=Capsicum baccatum TaxID=33114 RepID=A0A2G2XCE5_CAPBA|nr:hypothetical protein CQW23_03507 [Capsicum baccatum]
MAQSNDSMVQSWLDTTVVYFSHNKFLPTKRLQESDQMIRITIMTVRYDHDDQSWDDSEISIPQKIDQRWVYGACLGKVFDFLDEDWVVFGFRFQQFNMITSCRTTYDDEALAVSCLRTALECLLEILQKYTTFGEFDTHRLTFWKSPRNMGHNKTQSGQIQVSRLTKNGNTKDELRLPTVDTLLVQVKDGFAEGKDLVLSVMSTMGDEQIYGLGTNEKSVISALVHRNTSHRKKISETYHQLYNKSFIDDIYFELSSDFWKEVMLWTYEPFERNVRLAIEALKSRKKTITRLQVIVEIACASSPNYLIAVRQTNCGLFNHSLEEDIAENVPMLVHKILIGQVRSYRYDKELVDPDTANAEATILREAIRTKQLDNDNFLIILRTRNVHQLRAIFFSFVMCI